jgi:hypothetical protein
LANGYLDVKSHPWFSEEGILFSKMLKKEAPAPWVPEVKDPLDLSATFDARSSDEAIVLDDRKLTRYEQELFRDF